MELKLRELTRYSEKIRDGSEQERRKGVDIQKENGVKYMNSWVYAVLYANFSSLGEEKVNKQKKYASTKALTFISIISFL